MHVRTLQSIFHFILKNIDPSEKNVPRKGEGIELANIEDCALEKLQRLEEYTKN